MRRSTTNSGSSRRTLLASASRQSSDPPDRLRPDVGAETITSVGPRPSSVYIIAPDARIVFRAHWSNVTSEIERAVAAVANGEQPPGSDAGGTVRAMVAMTGHAATAFRTAGPGATLDTWKAAPPFGVMIVMSRLFGFLQPSRRGTPTMLAMGAVLAVTVALLLTT